MTWDVVEVVLVLRFWIDEVDARATEDGRCTSGVIGTVSDLAEAVLDYSS